MKTVQIPYDLFLALLRYHLTDDEVYDEDLEEIRQGLQKKLDAILARDLYSRYKTAPTQQEQEAARQAYLDRRGVPESFRWKHSFDTR